MGIHRYVPVGLQPFEGADAVEARHLDVEEH